MAGMFPVLGGDSCSTGSQQEKVPVVGAILGVNPPLWAPWDTPGDWESLGKLLLRSRKEQCWGRWGWEGLENLGLLGKNSDIGDHGSGHTSSWQELLQRQLLLSRVIWNSQESLTQQEEPHPDLPGWDQREFHGRKWNNSGTRGTPWNKHSK